MNLVLLALLVLQDSDKVLRDALEKTGKEAFGIQGTVRKAETEGLPEGGPGGMMMMGGGSLEGDLTGKLADKEAMLQVDNKDKGTSLELFKKGDKTVKRSTWVKEPAGAGPAIQTLLKLTNFEALAHAARDGKFEEAVEETSDGKSVLRIRGTLPEKLLDVDEERAGPGPGMMMMGGKVKKITLDARVDKESGLVQSLSFTIERELDFGGMQVKRFGPGGGDDMDMPEMPKIQIKQSFEYKVAGTGEEHKPRFPEGIEKHFQ